MSATLAERSWTSASRAPPADDCCLNCHAYDESMRYGCREPQAEPPADKERANACELFVFKKGDRAPKEEDPRAKALSALDALFKK